MYWYYYTGNYGITLQSPQAGKNCRSYSYPGVSKVPKLVRPRSQWVGVGVSWPVPFLYKSDPFNAKSVGYELKRLQNGSSLCEFKTDSITNTSTPVSIIETTTSSSNFSSNATMKLGTKHATKRTHSGIVVAIVIAVLFIIGAACFVLYKLLKYERACSLSWG